MAENPRKNIHKHNMGGIIFASILLICIALASLIITLTALNKDKAPSSDENEDKNPQQGDSVDAGLTDGSESGGEQDDNSEGTDNSENENDTDQNDNKPETVEISNDKIYSGPLLQLDSDHPYRRPVEELISRSAMNALGASKRLELYNFTNINTVKNGNFLVANNQLFLDVDAANAFGEMMKNYVLETGNQNIQVRNAYFYLASNEDALYDPRTVGMAVDLEIKTELGNLLPLYNQYGDYSADEYYAWFVTNCYKYGYIHVRNTENYSTFRYVGTPHSEYMGKENLSLENYLKQVREATPTDRLVISDSSGNEWWIYYVEASDGDSTNVTVYGKDYFIYGDNVGGFIVTVDCSGI